VRNSRHKNSAYRHHCAAARASHEDLGCVRLVLLESPLDHVGNGVAVATALVGQCLLAADVPAGPGVGRAGVDDDEAILLRKSLIWATGIVCLSSAAAVVNRNNDTGRSCELLGHVDVERSLGWSVAKGGHLLEAARGDCALSEGGRGGNREKACEKCEKTHRDYSLNVFLLAKRTKSRVSATA
jgi:hypothetical protein